YGLEMTVPEQGFKTVEFIADRPGALRFRCSTTCGPFHPFMVGKFVAGPNYLFWGSLAGALVFPAGVLTLASKKRRRADR
ncbi:MAG: cupredoxin domain-containing protein, partial [Planctomycetota bacterium]